MVISCTYSVGHVVESLCMCCWICWLAGWLYSRNKHQTGVSNTNRVEAPSVTSSSSSLTLWMMKSTEPTVNWFSNRCAMCRWFWSQQRSQHLGYMAGMAALLLTVVAVDCWRALHALDMFARTRTNDCLLHASCVKFRNSACYRISWPSRILHALWVRTSALHPNALRVCVPTPAGRLPRSVLYKFAVCLSLLHARNCATDAIIQKNSTRNVTNGRNSVEFRLIF